MQKIAFMASLGFQTWEPERVVGTLQELGYEGVEWTLAHFNPHTKSPAELQRVVDVTREAGLGVSEVVVQQDFVTRDEAARRDRIDLVKDCIRAAADTGVPALNLFTGPAPWDPNAPKLGRDISEGQAWAYVQSAFAEIVPLAVEHEVYLAVEAVFGHTCREFYTTRFLLDAFPSPYLAINMDPSHYALYGNDVPWVVEQFADKIVHVHLKDVVGRPGGLPGETFQFPLLGEGIIDWAAFFAALDRIGYNGYCSVEFEAFRYAALVLKNDPVKMATLSMEQWRALRGVDS
jgi:sugar phosphate isomerase/epimerase